MPFGECICTSLIELAPDFAAATVSSPLSFLQGEQPVKNDLSTGRQIRNKQREGAKPLMSRCFLHTCQSGRSFTVPGKERRGDREIRGIKSRCFSMLTKHQEGGIVFSSNSRTTNREIQAHRVRTQNSKPAVNDLEQIAIDKLS